MKPKNSRPNQPLERPKPMSLKKPATNTASFEMGPDYTPPGNPVLHKLIINRKRA